MGFIFNRGSLLTEGGNYWKPGMGHVDLWQREFVEHLGLLLIYKKVSSGS